LATRSASTQAARQAWQDLRAGEGPRQLAARRRLNAAAGPQRPASNASISADSSQP